MQRDVLYEAATALCGQHPDASQLYDYVHKNYPTISRGTVYRNLGVLCEEGRIIKIPMEDGAHCYDVRLDPHSHFYCHRCHRITDLQEISVGFKDLESQGYDVRKQTIILSGICPKCKEAKEL